MQSVECSFSPKVSENLSTLTSNFYVREVSFISLEHSTLYVIQNNEKKTPQVPMAFGVNNIRTYPNNQSKDPSLVVFKMFVEIWRTL